ncbi:LOW QUALITY PROTEIN: uncharacterized protein LOC133850041 [Drosophila sulfurigaster albostrigata]|uniref:LOW QUALITY PROTEIN: uncharacterized protein LOC133850041 n=1 Tax=Drosophila sulfurigaster albostrigata TaxID=89887 RepID=UPI002D21983A|nr:LOW QUALITY PROTEIN: uncharacterized protein LOC133850041 [Drosophila sulfurigaster albostrigata]
MYRFIVGIFGKILLIVGLIFTFIFVNHNLDFVDKKQFTQFTRYHEHSRTESEILREESMTNSFKVKDEFKVFSSQCKIPRSDPFSLDSMEYFNPPDFMECTNQSDLITVQYDTERRQYRLLINEALTELIPNISDYGCIYKEIVRGEYDLVWTLPPIAFKQNLWVPRHIRGIIVECHELSNPFRVIQRDAFAFVQHPVDRNDKADEERSRSHPNVIIIGIDAMSQMNFQRTMPLTAKFVRQTGWYEMLGYNKVGDNTLPNVLALLTGGSPTELTKYCDINTPSCMDTYSFIWNHYRNAGYLTAYAEDLSTIDTFHYFLPGFQREPVDYYLHPFMKAIEQNMDKVQHLGYEFCVGRRQSYRYVLDYIAQIVQRFVQEMPKPLFGLFWMNSFSHDDFSGAASVDKDFVSYLEEFKSLGLFERSIVILLSDHGQRTGPLMDLPSSFLEERLPMFHIYLPPWYRQQYPEVARALHLNGQRLSSPYDLNLALKHQLQMLHPRMRFYQLKCPLCVSLFEVLPPNRSCMEAAIPPHWCTCEPHKQVTPTERVLELVRLVVYRMNQYLILRNHKKQCYHLKLRKLLLVERQQFFNDKGFEVQSPDGLDTYRFKFTTGPNDGLFRATLSVSKDDSLVVIQEEFITRLNSYQKDAYCIQDRYAKRFCACLRNQAHADEYKTFI